MGPVVASRAECLYFGGIVLRTLDLLFRCPRVAVRLVCRQSRRVLFYGTLLVAGAVCARGQDQTPANLAGQSAPVATVSSTTGSTVRFAEVRAFTNLTRITGVAADRSFLTDGNNNGIDLSYFEDYNYGPRRVEF